MNEPAKPKMRIVSGGCDIIVQAANSESSFPDSHIILEVIETLIEFADLSFWEKFEGQVTPDEFFSAVLIRLARAWKAHAHWDERDPPNLIHVRRTLTEMLEELADGGHLPEQMDLPVEDEDQDE